MATKPSPDVEKLIEQLRSQNTLERIEAAVQFVNYPEHASSFVESLGLQLHDPSLEVREAAKFAFADLGEACVESTRSLLKRDDSKSFVLGCEIVRAIGPPAKALLPLLAEHLNSEDAGRRKAAVYAMMPMGELVTPYVDQLAPLLKDDDFNTQIFSCRTIIGMREHARPLASHLLQLAETGNVSTRSYAYWALGAIGPLDDVDVVELLTSKLDTFLHPEKQRALKGLALLGPHAAAATDRIRQLTTDEDANVEPDAAFALWKVTGEAQPSVDVLVSLYDHPVHQIASLELLAEMGEAAKPAESFLIGLLQVPDESIREQAIKCLANIRCGSLEAIETIRSISENEPDLMLRIVARRALVQLGQD